MATQLPLNVAFEKYVRERWGNNPKPYEIDAAAENLRQVFAQGELVATGYNAKTNREIEVSVTLWRVSHSDEVCPLVLSFFSSFGKLPLWRSGPYSDCTLLTDSAKFDDWLNSQASGSQLVRKDAKLKLGRPAVETERAMAAICKLYPDGVPNSVTNTTLEVETNTRLTNNDNPAHRHNKVSYGTIRKARDELSKLQERPLKNLMK